MRARTTPGCLLLMLLWGVALADDTPALTWTVATDPSALGWSAEKLDAAEKVSKAFLTESVMIVDKSGVVVRQWGPVDIPADIFSMRKSVISVLFGIHAAKGRIDLQATLADLGIDDERGLTDAEKKAKVIDLLKARSGVYHPAAWETRGMMANRPERGSKAPGEKWFYNNWDFNALNTIFAKSTGRSVTSALVASLAEPLGFEDFSSRQSFLLYEDLSEHPSALLWMSGRDLARLGLMLLRNGDWYGTQVVPAAWIAESTAPHSDVGILGGYGYSWWAAREGLHFPFIEFPDGTYSARGTGEQVLLVIPAWDTVIVHRAPVCGPGRPFMHVIDFAKVLKAIVDARLPDPDAPAAARTDVEGRGS